MFRSMLLVVSLRIRRTFLLKTRKIITPAFKKVDNITESILYPRIEGVLTKADCKINDGFTCIQTTCVTCDGKKGSLYINKITGFFICLDCQNCGPWSNLENQIISVLNKVKSSNLHKELMLKDFDSVKEGNNNWQHLTQSANALSAADSVKQQTVLSTFGFSDLSDRLIKELNVYYDDKNLYFPLQNSGRFIVGYKRLSSSGEEHTIPVNGCLGIIRYIPSKIKKKITKAVIVPTIKDFLALSECKLPFHIICLPHETSVLPQEILPLLEHYEKLVLWFDSEAVGLTILRTFSNKLGAERCYFVKTTDRHYNAYIAWKNGINLDVFIESSYPVCPKQVTKFSSFRQAVLSDLQNKERSEGIKWKRFPKLNELLRGQRRGELTILTGPTGCGKTTFIAEYSLDLAMQGVNTLWGSFEIRNERLARVLLQQMVEVPLEKNLDKFNLWADEFETLPIYFMTFHGAQPINTVMETIKHCTYVHDIAHVIIDNVQFMMGLSDVKFTDKFYKQDLIIQEFRSFATKYNCHVTLVIHPRKENPGEALTINSIFGGVKASQEADNILILQIKMLQSLQIKKFLQVAKNRYTGDLGIMPLTFNKENLSFAMKTPKVDKFECKKNETDH